MDRTNLAGNLARVANAADAEFSAEAGLDSRLLDRITVTATAEIQRLLNGDAVPAVLRRRFERAAAFLTALQRRTVLPGAPATLRAAARSLRMVESGAADDTPPEAARGEFLTLVPLVIGAVEENPDGAEFTGMGGHVGRLERLSACLGFAVPPLRFGRSDRSPNDTRRTLVNWLSAYEPDEEYAFATPGTDESPRPAFHKALWTLREIADPAAEGGWRCEQDQRHPLTADDRQKLVALLKRWRRAVETIPVEVPPSPEGASPGKSPKEPSREATAAYQLLLLTGKTQAQIAEQLGRKFGIRIGQYTVSRWIKQARTFFEATGTLPSLESQPRRAVSVDPMVIDMGERQRRTTRRQRADAADDA